MKNKKYILAVHKSLNLTFSRYKRLKEYFANDWQKIWEASQSELIECGIDKRGREKFLVNRKNISPESLYESIQKENIDIIFYNSEEYPWQLKNIYNPPIVLFCKGTLKSSDFPSIAIVGARKITSYGKNILESITPQIAQSAGSIVSGFAFGVDVLAHKIAFDSGARVISILGNPIDRIYPASHTKFAHQLLESGKGVFISEYFPGSETRPENFPARNRIIAGLCKALIVIEAGKKSGSLITAKLALENGKELFAVPGDIFSKMSEGTNYLLSKGMAHAAISSEYILEMLGMEQGNSQLLFPPIFPENPEEQHLLELFSLNQNLLHIDDIFRLSHLEKIKITSLLSFLEIKGRIKSIGANKYILHG